MPQPAAADVSAAVSAPVSCPPVVAPRAGPAPRPQDRGPLWRLRRDGRTSYLYGTVHVGRPDWGPPGPQVQAALRATRTLALELDLDAPEMTPRAAGAAAPGTPAAAVAAPDSGAANAEPLAPALPVALQQRLAAANARACLPAGMLAGLPPLVQASALVVLDARWLGLDPAYGVDRRLASLARARGQRVVGLEKLSEQTQALQPADAQVARVQLEQTLAQLEDGRARRVMARLVRAWEAGDMAQLERHETWCECTPSEADRQLMQRVNDLRNPKLAAGIEALHARGSVFAAVGALHMTGPAALPLLLKARGFAVERVRMAPGAR